MPASLVRLRIAGFKSFAEPTVVELHPGLTGIVGPNGCGKSNVAEALRWVMGESSARHLRGGEMDDVIFSGTAHRPRRDIAEVTLSLAETAGLAPPPFHDQPELEIRRRIERAVGSVYRVNGREARARDVQTLFADLATGSRSSAMVTQGRVSAVVAASPADRRAILEEAAGITGLHARRHEAEVKLRATEANLLRAQDLRGQLETQLEGLRRQARQAARFRDLGEAVRAAEAELFAVQDAACRQALAAAVTAEAAAREAVTRAAAAAIAAAAGHADAAAALPAVRSAEAACRTALERARLEAEQARAAAAAAEQASAGARATVAQIARDLQHAEALDRDAAAALSRLSTEAARLAGEDMAHPGGLAEAETRAVAAAAALAAAEQAAEAATEMSADLLARYRSATAARHSASTRALQLRTRAEQLSAESARARAGLVPQDRLRALQETAETARAASGRGAAALETAERRRPLAQAALATARAESAAAEAARARLAATAQGVREALGAAASGKGARMVDALTVPRGLETALAAALGEDLDSAIEPAQARHWRDLPALDPVPLPEGAMPLAGIGAPPALRRVLGHIGLVETDGAAMQAALQPGQILVSRDGGAWRWDGHTVRPGTKRPAAIRLQQRNHLASLLTQLTEAEAAAAAAGAARIVAETGERAAIAAEQQARAARKAAEQEAERAASECAALTARHEAASARLTTLQEQVARAKAEQDEAEQAAATAESDLAGLGDPAAARTQMEQARTALATARADAAGSAARVQTLGREAAARTQRQRVLVAEQADWAMRVEDARGRVIDLAGRRDLAAAQLAACDAAPSRNKQAQDAAQARLLETGAAHRQAATALEQADARAIAAAAAERQAEAALAGARERAVRAEAGLVVARHESGGLAERMLAALGPSPDLPDRPAASPEAEDRARKRLERLQREREEMGPINLRAELEAGELETQIATILRETEELTTAIAKLRGSIGHINREGRERLGQIFADIDRHFRALFERMFGGGKAHLALVGSDDPLQAGLEIYAQPPGKKLSSVSLLSGGEQALAALSLIFAVFRCQPAPVCVLDEVDAPLDDANVARFCTLLEDMVQESGTRFLVITHHQLTMARMDRLYGVTMQERGVSRLLSVDFQRAVQMVEPGRMAAE